MNNRIRVLVGLIGVSASAWAYEVDTHAVIADRAFERSVLAGTNVFQRFGWNRYRVGREFQVPPTIGEYPYFDRYIDLVPGDWSQTAAITSGDLRYMWDWERNNFPGDFRGGQPNAPELERQIRAWLMRGAVREDDLPLSEYEPTDPPPDTDPHGNIIRVFGHFYDPVLDRPLVPLGGSGSCAIPGAWSGSCLPTPDWVLGELDADSASPTVNSTRRNHFTWTDAREAMWCGLTYRNSGVSPQRDAALRRLCWATSVKALGQVLHGVQDMAQPQHVRNDGHNPPHGDYTDVISTSTTRRTYEIYTNWRATRGADVSSPQEEQQTFRSMFGSFSDSTALSTRAYPIPRFARPSDYFTTRRDGLAVNTRRGMADFTNRNFYSEGTVLSTDYPSPPSNLGDPSLSVITTTPRLLADGSLFREQWIYFPGSDPFEPIAADPALIQHAGLIPLGSVSIWSRPSEIIPARNEIPLDFYQAHADMLIPRAIAYSAGLIDFFFRGTLDVLAPTDTPVALLDHGTSHTVANGYPMSGGQVFGFRKARLRVRNTTPTIIVSGAGSVAQAAASGQLVAVARYHRNPCYLPSLNGEWTYNFANGVSSVPSGACSKDQLRTPYEELSSSAPFVINSAGQLDGGSPTLFEFDFSADPIPVNATDLRFQVVYRGQLGEERDGIAVGNLDTREPGYYAIQNGTDYFATQGAWQQAPSSGPNAPANLTSISSDFFIGLGGCVGSGVRLFTATNLAPSRILRVAVVEANRTSELKGAAAIGGGTPTSICGVSNIQPPRQAATEEIAAGAWSPHPVGRVRGYSYDKAYYWHKVENGDVPPSEFGQSLPNLQNVSPVPGVVVFAAGIPARHSETGDQQDGVVASEAAILPVDEPLPQQ